jgi:hypothetical protein
LLLESVGERDVVGEFATVAHLSQPTHWGPRFGREDR